MPITQDAQYQHDVADLAIGMGEALTEGVVETLGLTPVGAQTPTAEQIGAFFAHQGVMYPPQLFEYPDGHTVYASPWILALQFCGNGAEWLNKYNAFLKKSGYSL